MTAVTTRLPDAGTLMKDLTTGRFGEFQAKVGGWYFLRPVRGGREWEVRPEDARQATYAEVQRIRHQAGVSDA